MSTTSSARPGLRAHVDSTRLSFQDLVTRVTAIIGRKLTAYIAGVDVRTVDRWVKGSNPYGDAGDHRARGIRRGSTKQKYPGGWKALKPYLRFVAQPS